LLAKSGDPHISAAIVVAAMPKHFIGSFHDYPPHPLLRIIIELTQQQKGKITKDRKKD
jgi:hypothetical protein